MKKKLYFIWALVLVATLWTTGYFVAKKVFIPKEVHYHAGFVVFQNNKKIDFSDFKYMSIKPCSLKNEERLTDEELQSEKGHLHDNIDDVVHVHRERSRWRDLFANLKYPLNYSGTTAYINGQKVEDWQNQKIEPYQSLVVFVGENDQVHLGKAVTKQYIQEVEKKSENCGSKSH